MRIGIMPTLTDPKLESPTLTDHVEPITDPNLEPIGLIEKHYQKLLFETENQSMFGTGDAIVLEPDLPFLGFEINNKSLSKEIIKSHVFEGKTLKKVLDGFEGFANSIICNSGNDTDSFGTIGYQPTFNPLKPFKKFWEVVTTTAVSKVSKTDTCIDLPDAISTPRVGTNGYLDAKVGLQPYFYLTSGEVDASIPVEVWFAYPSQVKPGEIFTIDSFYSLADSATYSTMSPDVKVGMDFVFDVAAELYLEIGSNNIKLFGFNTRDLADFEGALGDPGFNIFDLSTDSGLETSIDLAGMGTLDLNFPIIETTGNSSGSNVLTSSGEDSIATLNVDIDAIAAEIISAATGVPITFSGSDSYGLEKKVAGKTLNLLSVDYTWEAISVGLKSTLKAIQDFELNVEDLPLVATLENGSKITGFSLGDPITLTAPDINIFDANVDGDADGFIDLKIDVDMNAVFSNLTTLGLDLELFTGLLKFDVAVNSDFAPDLAEFSLFNTNDSGYLLSETTTFLSNEPLATLFDKKFDLIGWNSDSAALQIDIA